ncbi:MAG: pilus assembly protein TadG-related protein, partial [Solirubrobacteraceae bacterium]
MLLIVTVLMTAILASAALAIDVGSFYHSQRQAQAAADAGALAAAQDMADSGSATATNDGTTIAQTNYPGSTITVSEPTTNEAKVVVNAFSP